MRRPAGIALGLLLTAAVCPAVASGWELPPAHLAEPHPYPLTWNQASWLAANVTGDRAVSIARSRAWRSRQVRFLSSEVIDCHSHARKTIWWCEYRLRLANRQRHVVLRERGLVRVTHKGWLIRPAAIRE